MRSSPHAGRDEAAVVELERVHRRVVADLHAERFGAAVVRVDQRLAAAHEERVGARQVQRARQRRLEAHAVPAHPVAAGRRRADHEPRELLVGGAAGDLQQVLPVLLFRIGVDQHVLRRVVHAAQVARVLRVAAAPFARRRLRAAARWRRLRAPSARRTARRCRRRSPARRAAARAESMRSSTIGVSRS